MVGDLTCGECGEGVSLNDAVCPSCWAVLDQALLERKRQRQALLVGSWFTFIVVGLIVGFLVYESEPSELDRMEGADVKNARARAAIAAHEQERRKPSAPKVVNITHNGPVVIGRRHSKGVLGAKLFATLEIKEHIAENPTTYDEFQAAGLMFGAAAHTKGIVRDVSWSGPVKVELLSGVNAGKVGWIDREYILEGGEW